MLMTVKSQRAVKQIGMMYCGMEWAVTSSTNEIPSHMRRLLDISNRKCNLEVCMRKSCREVIFKLLDKGTTFKRADLFIDKVCNHLV